MCGIGTNITSQLARQVRYRRKDTAGDDFPFNACKPDFDLVEPGRVGRCEMQVHVWVSGEEILHQLGFVGRKVIQNNVEFLFGWTTGDDFA
jgi:hypothetical protein